MNVLRQLDKTQLYAIKHFSKIHHNIVNYGKSSRRIDLARKKKRRRKTVRKNDKSILFSNNKYKNKWDITKAVHFKTAPGNVAIITEIVLNGTTIINGNTLNAIITMVLIRLY